MSDRRILVIRLGAMGDIIHALPAVASLKQSFPGSRLTWVVDRKWPELLRDNPFVDEVASVDRKSVRSLLALRKYMRRQTFDLAVDFQGLIKSAAVASSARPERIFGFHRSQVREPLAALFYSHGAKVSSKHVVDQNLELAEAAGVTSIARVFPIPPGRPEGTLPQGDFVLANPFAGWGSKQWPLEHYSQLAQQLERELGLPLVLNVSADAPLVAGAHVHVSGLQGLFHATRLARAVVGVDSGPLHLAAALGKPGVAIFGPTDPARNGPYGGTVTVLRSPEALTTYKRSMEIDSAMSAISPGSVFECLRKRLG